jgi:hypothetical protein
LLKKKKCTATKVSKVRKAALWIEVFAVIEARQMAVARGDKARIFKATTPVVCSIFLGSKC